MALIHVTFFSESLGMDVGVDVILPQKATRQIGMAAATREGKHPTLWLLHGSSDDHTIWQRRTSIERYAAPLGLAVVMPAVQHSSYANMAHGGRFYDYVSEELPRVMRDFFPLSDKREDNFIAGLSMGGMGCMKIGLANPDKYAAIGCLSAFASDIDTPRAPRGGAAASEQFNRRRAILYGDRDLHGTEEDTWGNARKIVAEGLPAPRIFHSTGKDDFLVEGSRQSKEFFESFPGNPFDYQYSEYPGAHTWEYWDEHIQDFLKYIGLMPVEGIRN